MNLKRLTLLLALVGALWGEDAALEAIKTRMAKEKAAFDTQLADYAAKKKSLDAAVAAYNVAQSKADKNAQARKINEAKQAASNAYAKAVELKEAYNTSAYQLAQKRHELLAALLAEEEMVLAQKENSCLNLTIDQCKQKAYDVTKQEVEKFSKEAILKRVKESGIEVAPDKVEAGVRYNVQSYANVDEGYFYALKSEVNGQLTLDERQMFPVTTITWNEQFEEPKEVAQIPLDNLTTPNPEGLIAPEEAAPSVYHSGFYVAADLTLQNHDLSGGGSEDAYGVALKAGFKEKDKTRYYLAYEWIDDGATTITLTGIQVDWAVNLEKAIYPFWGLGYSIAKLNGKGYDYEGAAYHARLGAGYEATDDLQVDLILEFERVNWMVANGNTNIYDLGIYRNIMRYGVSVSYLF